MTGREAALVLSPEVPYPVAGGGAIRTASILEYLAKRYELDVLVFREPGAPDPAATPLSQLASRLRVLDLPRHRRGQMAKIWRNFRRFCSGVPPLVDRFAGFDAEIAGFLDGRRYRLAVVEHFWCAAYGDLLARHAETTVLDLHNIESVLHERCAKAERGPLALLHRRFGDVCRRLEKQWLPRYSQLLAVSEKDAGLIAALAGETPIAVYPNTIPYRDPPPRTENQVVAFSGNLEYHPNVAAVRYFATRIWPRLRQRHPGLVWRLIGKNPEAIAGIVARDPRIQVTGTVEDAIAELARVRVAVVPLLAGSGTRIKILEAWAAGTCVVSTSLGAEGLDAVDGEDLLLADGPAALADAVSRVLEGDVLCRRLAASGRARYEREFTWASGWNKLYKLGF